MYVFTCTSVKLKYLYEIIDQLIFYKSYIICIKNVKSVSSIVWLQLSK